MVKQYNKSYIIICFSIALLAIAFGYAIKKNPVRDRFLTVIEETHTLVKKARESKFVYQGEPIFDDRYELPIKRFPTVGDVKRYNEQRPWIGEYPAQRPSITEFELYSSELPRDSNWPTFTDAVSLRNLLKDNDPAIRGLAIEALATLHQPEDIPRIAKLLDDQNKSVSILGWNQTSTVRSDYMITPAQMGGRGD